MNATLAELQAELARLPAGLPTSPAANEDELNRRLAAAYRGVEATRRVGHLYLRSALLQELLLDTAFADAAPANGRAGAS